jgi:hypothetical protein
VWHSHRPGAGGDAALRKIAEKVAALNEPEAAPLEKAAPKRSPAKTRTAKKGGAKA